MATHWSSQNVVAEHKDIQATAMAVDQGGNFAVLAGRRLLSLVSLDDPSQVIRKSSRRTSSSPASKFDVKVVEWNPTVELKTYMALAAGNDCEVHVMHSCGKLVPDCLLHAHTRAISDINWHRSDAHLLATASVESYLFLWDVREPRRPMSKLPATSGATQVKWNRQNSHLLASGHEDDLRIWDSRKPDQPVLFLPDHMAKVNSIDWSPHNESHIVSADQDCVMRFSDVSKLAPAAASITTKQQVWKTKYTPFGHGVVTIMVPQLVRGDNSLLLWAADDPTAPAHSFVGHTDVVTNFEWRYENQQEGSDCQLVSWGRDRCLRMWRLDPAMQSLCGDNIYSSLTSDAEDDVSLDSCLVGSGGDSQGFLAAASVDNKQLSASKVKLETADLHSFTVDAADGIDSFIEARAGDNNTVTSVKREPETSHHNNEPLIQQFLEPRLPPIEDPASCFGGSTSTSTTDPSNVLDMLRDHVPTLSSSVPRDTSFGIRTPPSSLGSAAGQKIQRKATSLSADTTTTTTSSPPVDDVAKMTFKDELSGLRVAPWTDGLMGSVEVTTGSSQRQVQLVATSPAGRAAQERAGVLVSVHSGYPNAQRLHVSLLALTTLDSYNKMEMMATLNAVAEEHATRELNCLDALVRVLLSSVGGAFEDADGSKHDSSLEEGEAGAMPLYGSYRDHSVPFPRTSGARFCGNGVLVCFTRPTFLSVKNQKKTAVQQTPRSLSALGAYIGNFKPYLTSVAKPYSSCLKPHNSCLKTYNENLVPKPYGGSGKLGKPRQHPQLVSTATKKPASTQKQRHQQQGQGYHQSNNGAVTSAHHRGDGSLDRRWKQQQEQQQQQEEQKHHHQQTSRQRQRSLQNLELRSAGSCSDPERGATSCHHSRTAPAYNSFLDLSPDIEDDYHHQETEDFGDVSISKYYYQEPSKRRSRGDKKNVKVGEVIIYSVEGLLPLSFTLAAQYRLHSHDPVSSCLHNRAVALSSGRRDLVQVWSLAANIVQLAPDTEPSSSIMLRGLDAPWAEHPMARPVAAKLLAHFIDLGDIQTAAMLSCVFGVRCQQQQQQQLCQQPQQHSSRRSHHHANPQTGGSPYNTIHGLNVKGETSLDPCPLVVVRHNRSNSEGSLPEAPRTPHESNSCQMTPDAPHSPSKAPDTRFLSYGRGQQYEEIRRAYCNILYNWQLLDRRAEVQQYCGTGGGALKDAEFLSECGRCKQLLRSHYCPNCRKPAVMCSICQLPVRGHSIFCLWCGHGGHTSHLLGWFTNNDLCATGCGCDCINYFNQQTSL